MKKNLYTLMLAAALSITGFAATPTGGVATIDPGNTDKLVPIISNDDDVATAVWNENTKKVDVSLTLPTQGQDVNTQGIADLTSIYMVQLAKMNAAESTVTPLTNKHYILSADELALFQMGSVINTWSECTPGAIITYNDENVEAGNAYIYTFIVYGYEEASLEKADFGVAMTAVMIPEEEVEQPTENSGPLSPVFDSDSFKGEYNAESGEIDFTLTLPTIGSTNLWSSTAPKETIYKYEGVKVFVRELTTGMPAAKMPENMWQYDGREVYSAENPTPGAVITFSDSEVEPGKNYSYTVYAWTCDVASKLDTGIASKNISVAVPEEVEEQEPEEPVVPQINFPYIQTSAMTGYTNYESTPMSIDLWVDMPTRDGAYAEFTGAWPAIDLKCWESDRSGIPVSGAQTTTVQFVNGVDGVDLTAGNKVHFNYADNVNLNTYYTFAFLFTNPGEESKQLSSLYYLTISTSETPETRPGKPTNFKGETKDGKTITFSWDALTWGQNGGKLDTENLTYTITYSYNGKQTTVCENYKDTSIDYEIPEGTEYWTPNYTLYAYVGYYNGQATCKVEKVEVPEEPEEEPEPEVTVSFPVIEDGDEYYLMWDEVTSYTDGVEFATGTVATYNVYVNNNLYESTDGTFAVLYYPQQVASQTLNVEVSAVVNGVEGERSEAVIIKIDGKGDPNMITPKNVSDIVLEYANHVVSGSFVAPSKGTNLAGEEVDLTAVDKIDVIRQIGTGSNSEATTILSLTDAEPGKTYTFEDEGIFGPVFVQYTFLVYMGELGLNFTMESIECIDYIIPATPENFKAEVTEDNKVVLTWDAVTESVDGEALEGDVTYTVILRRAAIDQNLVSDLKDTTWTVDYSDRAAGEEVKARYGVRAYYEGYASDPAELEIEFTIQSGIENLYAEAGVSLEGGVLRVANSAGAHVIVADMNGVVYHSGNGSNVEVALAKGLYIVVVGGEAAKFEVK